MYTRTRGCPRNVRPPMFVCLIEIIASRAVQGPSGVVWRLHHRRVEVEPRGDRNISLHSLND